MAQTVISVRIDEELKRDAENLFNKLGMNISTAVNVFFRQSVSEQAIPFQIKSADKEQEDDYFNEYNMKRLLKSIEQAKAGNVIIKTMKELEEMADD